MTVYTVHEPRPRKGSDESDPERFVFVRDGFYFWAFVLGPLWMLRHRMWLVLLGFVVVTTAVQMALTALGISTGVKLLVGLLIALLIGFEAATLRRFSLRRWRSHGVVVASDMESAERRFFDLWTAHGSQAAPAAVQSGTVVAGTPSRMPAPAQDVIGLFPEPQSRP
ncbi:MAG: DUF2628 domain-containing protein [Alphaproteobacteria bacterium]|nr:DUF2628 domain-containing protein [Alphaproteobacteria bacterium]